MTLELTNKGLALIKKQQMDTIGSRAGAIAAAIPGILGTLATIVYFSDLDGGYPQWSPSWLPGYAENHNGNPDDAEGLYAFGYLLGTPAVTAAVYFGAKKIAVKIATAVSKPTEMDGYYEENYVGLAKRAQEGIFPQDLPPPYKDALTLDMIAAHIAANTPDPIEGLHARIAEERKIVAEDLINELADAMEPSGLTVYEPFLQRENRIRLFDYYFSEGRFDEATEMVQQDDINHDRKFTDATLTLHQKRRLERKIVSYSGNSKRYLSLGDAFQRQEQYARAIACWKRAGDTGQERMRISEVEAKFRC